MDYKYKEPLMNERNYPGTLTPVNKFGEKRAANFDALLSYEVGKNMATLPIVIPDLSGIKKIHNHLYGTVFDDGGKFRTQPMFKVFDSHSKQYAEPSRIESSVVESIGQLPTTGDVIGNNKKEIIKKIADFMVSFDNSAPFSVGNSTVMKAVAGQVLSRAGYNLNLSEVPSADISLALKKADAGNSAMLHTMLLSNTRATPVADVKNHLDYYVKNTLDPKVTPKTMNEMIVAHPYMFDTVKALQLELAKNPGNMNDLISRKASELFIQRENNLAYLKEMSVKNEPSHHISNKLGMNL